MSKIKIGDEVCFTDSTVSTGFITDISGAEATVKFKGMQGEPYEVKAECSDLFLVCNKVDTQKVQTASLNSFAFSLGYIFSQDRNCFVYVDLYKQPKYRKKIKHPFVGFNKMVEWHNSNTYHSGNSDSLIKYASSQKLVKEVKIQYAKRSKNLIVQETWVKYV